MAEPDPRKELGQCGTNVSRFHLHAACSTRAYRQMTICSARQSFEIHLHLHICTALHSALRCLSSTVEGKFWLRAFTVSLLNCPSGSHMAIGGVCFKSSICQCANDLQLRSASPYSSHQHRSDGLGGTCAKVLSSS